MSKKIQNQPSGASLAQANASFSPLTLIPFLGGLAFFLVVCLCSPGTIKATALFLYLPLAVAMVLLFLHRDRVTLPLLAMALMGAMGGFSAIYAVSGKFALHEFLKVLTAFSLTVILLAFCQGKNPGRAMAQVLAVSCAATSLVSIDLMSTRFLSGPVLNFLAGFSEDYANLAGVEPGVRMISIFNNGNIFAGVAGLGVLLSLALASAETSKGLRAAHICLLYINALAFVLAFSMGASGAIALAFLAYLTLEVPQRRSGTLALMVETLLLTVLAAVLISQTSLHAWDGVQPIPLLCALLGAAALWALDTFVGARVAGKLKGKTVLVVIAAILILLVAYVLAAYNYTTGVTLDSGETLRRAIYPEPGQYTLEVTTGEPSGDVHISVESQDQRETMMHTSTLLYQGPLDGAQFAVPEDSMVVYLNLTAQAEVRLDEITCTGQDGGSYPVPLNYPLLPGFMANRLQGLWANENAIQRLVFFSDGMKLFRRSPVVGLGMGAFENAIRSAQSFDYETKYAHNHYIQTLVETGVIGLVLFVGLLGVSAALVLLARRKKNEEGQCVCHPLVPALGAALVFMGVHAATEVVFSTYGYLPVAFGVFGLIGLCCSETVEVKWLGKWPKVIALGLISVLLIVFGFLLTFNVQAKSSVDQEATFDALVYAAETDPYEWADYALSYVNSVTVQKQNGNELNNTILAQANQYAKKLAQENSNTIPRYLAEFYFVTDRDEEAFAMIEKFVSYVSASPNTWNAAFATMYNYDDHTDSYHQSVRKIAQMLEDWNQANMGTIVLDEPLQPFLEHVNQ